MIFAAQSRPFGTHLGGDSEPDRRVLQCLRVRILRKNGDKDRDRAWHCDTLLTPNKCSNFAFRWAFLTRPPTTGSILAKRMGIRHGETSTEIRVSFRPRRATLLMLAIRNTFVFRFCGTAQHTLRSEIHGPILTGELTKRSACRGRRTPPTRLGRVVQRHRPGWIEQEPTHSGNDHRRGREHEHGVPFVAIREASGEPGKGWPSRSLPNMLPRPSTEPTWRPPMSW